jgi:hypothetical protein
MNCEFCDTYLKTISSLNYHKKTNQKCLEIQNISDNTSGLFTNCNYCNKLFTNQTLKKHLQTCKYKKIKEEEENKIKLLEYEKNDITIKFQNEIMKNENYQIEISDLKKEISSLRDEILKLQSVNNVYLQDREIVHKLALQPKTSTSTSNNNKIKVNNFFDNPERIKQMVDEKLTKNYICDGQKGVAQFAYNNLLKDEEGNMNYICSDPSRHIFKFQNSEGNIEKDLKANKLTNMLIDAGITHKTFSVAPSLWTEDDGKIDSNKFQTYVPYTTEISTMQIDNSVFRNELATLTSL